MWKLGPQCLYLLACDCVHQEAQDPKNHAVHACGAPALGHVCQHCTRWIHTRASVFLRWWRLWGMERCLVWPDKRMVIWRHLLETPHVVILLFLFYA